MRQYLIYLMVYSIGGFILERFINLAFLGSFYDNSVLVGPYQPLYGSGVLMTIIVYDLWIHKQKGFYLKYGLLLLIAIITTGISEAVTGYGMDYFFGLALWDYRLFFPYSLQYIGLVPTPLFGLLSFLVVVFIHPFIKTWWTKLSQNTKSILFYSVGSIFTLDIIYTFFFVL